MTRELHVGVLCSGTSLPAWQARCIEAIDDVDGVTTTVFVIDRPPGAGMDEDRGGLWDLYIRRVLSAGAAFGPLELTEISPTTRFHRWTDRATVEMTPDALLVLVEDEESALDAPGMPHGVWAFRFGGSGRGALPSPALIQEVSRRPPALMAALSRIDGHGEAVIQDGAFRTAGISVRGVLDAMYLGCADWPAAACERILTGHAAAADPVVRPDPSPVDPGAVPTLGRAARSYVSWQVRERLLFGDAWNIGMAEAPISEFLSSGAKPSIRWFPEHPSPYLMADPFGVQNAGQVHVLAEEWVVGKRASLRALEVSSSGDVSQPRPVGGLPQIASYPYLLEHDGEIYCIPETSQERRVGLYRATTFPDDWQLVSTLVEGVAAADPTLFRHEDRWWLLCTDTDRGRHGRLLGFYADELRGPWQPHPVNPLKWDVRNSRPAGTPFTHRGRLYRPAQDCSQTYGGAVVLNRIVELTTERFEETAEARVDPDPRGRYPRGLHTLSAAGDMTLVDGKRRRFMWDAYRRDASSVIRRRLGRNRTEGNS